MGKQDLGNAFELIGDQLVEAEKRLTRRRQKQKASMKTEEVETAPEKQELPKKKKEPKPKPQIISKPNRCNLTLKILESTDRKFNELFLRLQLAGDNRKKQDLAEEALSLLFDRYKSVFH